jgi:NSS family neurotransmitter:Na+ symporter
MGISKGIEKINEIIMPMIFGIFILLAIRSLTLPGAIEGVKYLLTPQWSYLFNINTWVMALGQAFFTVSLNGCGMVVYGSYIKKI